MALSCLVVNCVSSRFEHVGLMTSHEMVQVDDWFDFDTNPLYAIMHESIYCQVCWPTFCCFVVVCISVLYVVLHYLSFDIFRG